MAVYRFRVSFEDNEEIYREIEIKSTQNFEDFHNVIMQSISFDNVHDASFFISDNYWHKGDEIRLKPINKDDSSNNVLIRQMNKCKLAALIEDPHQKFVYVYDPKTTWTFLVELIKIVLDDAKVAYPLCVKTVGSAPKQYNTSNVVPVIVDEDEFDDEPHIDDEAYANAHSDDELAVLESEEGEEELVEATEEESVGEDDEFGASDLEDNVEGLPEED